VTGQGNNDGVADDWVFNESRPASGPDVVSRPASDSGAAFRSPSGPGAASQPAPGSEAVSRPPREAETESRPAESLVARGRRLLDGDEDRHDEAIAVLRRAVAAGEPEAVELLTRGYLERGFRFEAAELLAPRVKAGRIDLALPLAEALASTGDPDRAEEAYRIAVNAGDIEAMNDFGVFLRDRGRLAEAEQMLRRAAEAGHETAPVNLVEVQWESDPDRRVAIQTAEQWADEANPTSLLGLAFVRAAQARLDEAEELYRRAAELGAYRGHIEYARFLQDARDDLAGAERELEAAEREQEPGWALAFGQFLADVGRPDEARAYLRHAAHWGSLEAAAALEELDGDPHDD
jgi:Tfp pilus assembly protein PilF